MAITRWDPFRDLISIQNELNRLFGRTYAGAGSGGEAEATGGAPGAWVPPLEVYETQDRFMVTMELPGIAPDTVDVTVEDATLTVRGERPFYADVPEEAFHRVERRFGPFVRSLTLPPSAKAEAVDAHFEKGVLSIEVPKVEEAKPKKITVKAT
jgi:HSP20 family protein